MTRGAATVVKDSIGGRRLTQVHTSLVRDPLLHLHPALPEARAYMLKPVGVVVQHDDSHGNVAAICTAIYGTIITSSTIISKRSHSIACTHLGRTDEESLLRATWYVLRVLSK